MVKRFSAKLLNLLPLIFVFIASLYRPWDSDLGWHLKYGEYFFETGFVLRENIHSTEMAGFRWANTSWLTDLITYQLFNWGGFLGLTLAAALIITLTFWIFSKAYDLDLFEKALIFPVLLVLEKPVNEISFRGQLISMFFLGLLIFILRKVSDRKKLIFLPALSIIWINIHAQFILGLGILAIYLAVRIFEPLIEEFPKIKLHRLSASIKQNRTLIVTFVLCLAGGLINPFGLNLYLISLSHFNTPELGYILEYLPVEDLTNEWWKQMLFGIAAFFSLLYLYFTDSLRKWSAEAITTSLLYFLSFTARRYAWPLYYLGIPLIKPLAGFVKPDTQKNALRTAGVLFIVYIALAIYLKQPFSQFRQMNWNVYCQAYNKCSPAAIEFIKDRNLTNNLLSLYGWGGYMIWNYPEVKPSIDGRMTVWRDKNGYSALKDYYAYEQNWEDIDKSKYEVVLMWKEKPLYSRLEELVKEGKWEKRFEDEFAGVFVRKKISN